MANSSGSQLDADMLVHLDNTQDLIGQGIKAVIVKFKPKKRWHWPKVRKYSLVQWIRVRKAIVNYSWMNNQCNIYFIHSKRSV